MEERNVRQPLRIEHLGDRPPDVLVRPVLPGVDQGRALVVDQELVEGDTEGLRHGRDPVDLADDVVDPRLHRSSSSPVRTDNRATIPPMAGIPDGRVVNLACCAERMTRAVAVR